MGASEGGLGKRARNEVSPEMKIPESVVALEKPEKGGHIRVEVDEKNPRVGGENLRCKETDSCQEAPTVNIFSYFFSFCALILIYVLRIKLTHVILENNYLVGNVLILTPVHLFQRVYYSYFERRHQDEAFEDEDNVVEVRDPSF